MSPLLDRDTPAAPMAGGADGKGSGDWHLIDYLRVLVKRRWTALPVFAAVVISAMVALSMATPMYEARTQVLIEAESQPIVMFKEMVAQERASDQFYETQFKILQSRALARATVESLNGWDNPEWGAPDHKPGQARAILDSTIAFGRRILGMPVPTKSVPPPDVAETADESRIIYGFLRRLEIAPVPNSHLVDIKFQSPDPKLAATAANALARQYIQRNLDFKFTASKEATDWLTNQLAEQRTRVEQGEQALQRYREQNQASTNDTQNILTQKLNDATGALNRARSKRIEKETVFRQLEEARSNNVALADVPAIANNLAVKQLMTSLDELRRRRARLSRELGERHPEMIELTGSIQREENRLQDEIAAAAKLLETDYAAARAEEESFSKALNAQKAEAAFASRGDSGYQTIERDVAGNRQIFESLLQRTRESGISSEMNTNNIRVVDEADEPRSPVWPPRRQYTMLAVLLGGIAAVGLAFFAEYADNKVKSPDEVQQHLGLLCLGLVPQVSGPAVVESGPLIHNEVPRQFTESFRKIRSNVIFAMSERRQRTIIVTSTGPNEGKTTVATNLALGLAMTQQRVLLIDADMRRSRVHQVLNLDARPGLAELLTEQRSWDQVVRPYEGDPQLSLDVMLAGDEPDNPTELLSSARCKAMLAKASRDYDWVIVDSPPVLAVTDASILANTPSDVLFVVGSEINRLQTITKALEQLEVAKASFIGAVLNRARIDRNSFYYSDYIRKEYGEYYGGPTRRAGALGRFFSETVSRGSRS